MFHLWHGVLIALVLLASRRCSAREHFLPYSTPTATTGSPTFKTRTRKNTTPVPSFSSFHRLDLRAECLVPCGYYDQLCCNANEVCVTDVNTQAQCSDTGLPSMDTFTVIQGQQKRTVTVTNRPLLTVVFLPDSTIRETKVVDHTSTIRETRIINHVSMLVNNRTVVETRTQHISVVPPTKASTSRTSTADQVSTKSATAIPQHHKLSTPEKAGIGAGVVAAVLGIAGIIALLLKRRRRQQEQDEQARKRLDRDGDDGIPMRETAHIAQKPSQRVTNGQTLAPRAPSPQYGRSPFDPPSVHDGPPYDADAYYVNPVRSPDPMRNANDSRGFGGDRRSRRAMREEYRASNGYAPVPQPPYPPRNMPPGPVGGLPPTYEGDNY